MASDDTSTTTTSAADDHPAVRLVRLARRLSAGGVVDFHGLEADLRDLGQAVAVRAALHAAEAVRQRWAVKPHGPVGEADERALRAALDAARAWLAAPGDRARREAHRTSSRIKPLLRGLERRAYPSSPDPDELDLDEDDLDEDGFDDDLGEPDVDMPDDFDAALAHHAGTAVFAAARAAHARTAGSAAMHAGGALAAAYRVIDLEEAAGDLALGLPLVDPARAHAHGREPAASRLLLAALTAAVAPPSP